MRKYCMHLNMSIFYSSKLIKNLLQKFYLHLHIMKHKQSPDVFLPEKKMKETSSSDQIYTIFET